MHIVRTSVERIHRQKHLSSLKLGESSRSCSLQEQVENVLIKLLKLVKIQDREIVREKQFVLPSFLFFFVL